jgi:hypothetical protein
MSGRTMNGGRDQPNFCDVTTPTLVRPRTCGILASPFQGHTYVPAHKQQNNPYWSTSVAKTEDIQKELHLFILVIVTAKTRVLLASGLIKKQSSCCLEDQAE